MTKELLTKAGRLAFVNAVLTIPLFILSIMLGLQDSYGARVAQTMLMLASTLLFVYILLALRGFLNTRHGFHNTDAFISVQIWASVALTVFSMLGLLSQSLQEAGGMFALIMVVPLGIVQVVFGYRLLRLGDSLHGRLKPFCWLTMMTGFSFAVIVLIPLGFLTSAAADVFLGLILIRAGGDEPLRVQGG